MQQAEYRFGSGTTDLIKSGSETMIKTMDPQSEKMCIRICVLNQCGSAIMVSYVFYAASIRN